MTAPLTRRTGLTAGTSAKQKTRCHQLDRRTARPALQIQFKELAWHGRTASGHYPYPQSSHRSWCACKCPVSGSCSRFSRWKVRALVFVVACSDGLIGRLLDAGTTAPNLTPSDCGQLPADVASLAPAGAVQPPEFLQLIAQVVYLIAQVSDLLQQVSIPRPHCLPVRYSDFAFNAFGFRLNILKAHSMSCLSVRTNAHSVPWPQIRNASAAFV